METGRYDQTNSCSDHHSLDAAPARPCGVAAMVDAFEYLVLLHAADDEMNFGADADKIREAGDRLRAVSPEHVLVRLLDAKAQRVGVVQELLSKSVRRTRGEPERQRGDY